MSEGLQKILGDHLRKLLDSMSKNRFSRLVTGILVTASIQSSTAATVMTVSFVSAGLFSLAQAISVIMGANIGTTITSWLMAFIGFKWNTTLYMLPLLATSLPFMFSSKSKWKSTGELILGFSLMFLGLAALRATLSDPESGCIEEFTHLLAPIQEAGGGGILLFILIGTLTTFLIQSSAATQAVTLALCSLGIIDIYSGAALIVGENIGSALIPFTASLRGNAPAKRAGLAHLIFNIIGAIAFLIFLTPITHWVNDMMTSIMNDTPPAITTTFTLSALHTLFNLLPALILIWFVKGLEKLAFFLIPVREEDDEEFRLQAISGGLLSTGEISILQVRKEIALYAARAHKMFALVQRLMHTNQDNGFSELYSRIEKYERIMDNTEVEIANYLSSEAEGRLSSEGKLQVRAMLREITEIESIGDSCHHLARTLNHKRDAGIEFDEKTTECIRQMMKLLDDAFVQMKRVIAHTDYHSPEMAKSYAIEKEINNYRNKLKNQNLEAINNKEYDYKTGVSYMDMITECEKMGNSIINTIEASGESKIEN